MMSTERQACEMVIGVKQKRNGGGDRGRAWSLIDQKKKILLFVFERASVNAWL